MNTLLEARNITKTYDNKQQSVLKEVSLNVNSGEFLGIMGASGSGKTTLLNVLSTIDEPTSGDVVINGTNLNALTEKKAADFRRDYLGFIFQEYFLLESLTIKENIAVPLSLKGYKADKLEKEVYELSVRLGISSQLEKYPNELSGGQRQRVAAARAIIKKPELIFADEPTGALDSSSSTELLKALGKANDDLKSTILMVTHDAYAASFCKRIVIFKDGRIIQEIFRGTTKRNEFYHQVTKEISKLDSERIG